MEEENHGLTLRGVCKTIWLRKWVGLIVAIAVALICSISLYYGYNYRVANYVMEFSLNLPGDDNGVVYIYPNGSQLYYADMTSLTTLIAIKNSNEEFSDIDVESMATKGNISIARSINVLVSETATSSAYREITYTITAKASCFASAAQAKNFLAEIANTPVEYLENMTIDYGVYLDNFDKIDNYEKEIELLSSQLEVLKNGYSSLISEYGDGVVIENNRTLFAYAHDVELYVESNEIENLLTRVQDEHLLKSESCKESYRLEKIRIDEQLEDATKTLDTLITSEKAYLDGASVIKSQQDLVNSLTRRQKLIEEFLTGNNVDESFEDEIQKAYARVQELTNSYSKTSETVYSSASSVVYIQPGVIEKVGGMGLTKILVLSVIVAVIVALIAAYVAGYYKLRAINAAESNTENKPVNEEKSADSEAENKKEDKE